MKITAVVCAYWPERFENVRRIISDLLTGERVPDQIIVLHNGDRQARCGRSFAVNLTSYGAPRDPAVPQRASDIATALQERSVVIIEGGNNWECRGKYVTALLEPSDYYLLLDDDTTVSRYTVGALERQVTRHPEVHVTGYWGVLLQNAPGGRTFSNGILVGNNVHAGVDAFHGRYLFCTFEAIVNMLAVEAKVRTGGQWQNGEGDDLLIGLANRAHCYVLNLSDDERAVDLSEEGVAMCHADGYFEMRDRFLNDALAVL